MPRLPYSGADRKLLLAFDVGVTRSGISYCILDPGKVPEIMGVYKFPGQEMTGGNTKIHSVMYYSRDGQVRAAGAETERDGIDIVAKEEVWVKVERFMLHLRPRSMLGDADVPPLPPGKTIVEVLSDFLKYLNECARQYIQEVHPGIGTDLWNGSTVHYILTHHNEWEGPQQASMKQAAQKAGLIMPHGWSQITFITEGEASLRQCINEGLMSESMRRGEGVAIIDACERTVNISAYASRNRGKTFEEIAEPQYCEGSASVTEAAGQYMNELLKDSRFCKDIPEMKRYFDRTTKHAFCDPNDPSFIRFGSIRDRDVKLCIISGMLRLDGSVVASFFEPTIRSIVNGVLAQRCKSIFTVFLVGRFAANDYLFRRLKEDLKPHGVQVFRPNTLQTNKIVADGAISKIVDSLSDSLLEQLVEGFDPPDLEVFGKFTKVEGDVYPSGPEPPTSTPTFTTTVTQSPTSSSISAPLATAGVVTPSHSPPPTNTLLTNGTVTTPSTPLLQASPPDVPSGNIDKLTDGNYLEWRVYMTAVLVSKGLLGVVDGSEGHPGGAKETKRVKKFHNKKARARAELILHVSPSQLVHCSHEDPVVIWNALATAHAAHKRITINTLRRKLYKARLEDDETMSVFIGRVRHMAFLVKKVGGDIDDDDVISFITAGLPSSYDSCLAIDVLPDSEYNIDVISDHLVREYQQRVKPRT